MSATVHTLWPPSTALRNYVASPSPAALTTPRPTAPLSAVSATQSLLSPSSIVAHIENHPDLAKLRPAISNPNLTRELKKPERELDWSGAEITLWGREKGARINEKEAKVLLAQTQYLSKRNELIKKGYSLLLSGVRNRMEQQEKRQLLQLYDTEINGLLADIKRGVSNPVLLRRIQVDRNKVQQELTNLRAVGDRINIDLSALMGVDKADLDAAKWPSLHQPVSEYLTVRPANSPQLRDGDSLVAHYRRESGLMNVVRLKKGGWEPRQLTHNWSYTQLTDLARRLDVPRQTRYLEHLLVKLPNAKLLNQLANAFPSLWAQAANGSPTPNTATGALLATTSTTALLAPPSQPAAADPAERARFASLLVQEAQRDPNVMAALLRKCPVAVTQGGKASVFTLKPTDLPNVDRAGIARDLQQLRQEGKGGSLAAEQRALILSAFAQLDLINAKGKGIKIGVSWDQVLMTLTGGAPLSIVGFLTKNVQGNFSSRRNTRIETAQGQDALIAVILEAMAVSTKAMNEITATVSPMVYGAATTQRRADLRQQLQAENAILNDMTKQVRQGVYTPQLQHGPYGINYYQAKRNAVVAEFGLRLDSLVSREATGEQDSVLFGLLNLYEKTGQIANKKVQNYLGRILGFPNV